MRAAFVARSRARELATTRPFWAQVSPSRSDRVGRPHHPLTCAGRLVAAQSGRNPKRQEQCMEQAHPTKRFGLAARRLAAAGLIAASAFAGGAGALAVGLGVANAQTTDISTPQNAAPFTGTANGQIPGGVGGHFAYYKFEYPGGYYKASIGLIVASPQDQNVLQNVGFKVYGPTPGKVYGSDTAQRGLYPSAQADVISNEAGEYVIQIYNFAPDPNAVVTYTLSSRNLPPQPGATPVPT